MKVVHTHGLSSADNLFASAAFQNAFFLAFLMTMVNILAAVLGRRLARRRADVRVARSLLPAAGTSGRSQSEGEETGADSPDDRPGPAL